MGIWSTSQTSATVSALFADNRRSDRLCFILIFFTALSLLLLSLLGGVTLGFDLMLAILPILLIAALIVRWPVTGFYVTFACTVLIEDGPNRFPVGTDNLPVYHWPIGSALEGSFERPIGFLFIFIFFVIIIPQLTRRQKLLRGGPLFLPFVLYLLCVSGGIVHGLTSGGDLKTTVIEVRPFWYLFESYILAYNLVTKKAHIRALLWIVIIGAGVKSLQGLYILLIDLHGHLEGISEIMAHEESFFFIALILLFVLFCLHYRYRPQLYAALLVLPTVLIALVVNQRRADYFALVLGLAFAWTIVYQLKPHARKALVLGMLVCVVLAAGYVIAFSHSAGLVGEPARAVLSIINPSTADTRDANSNLYRLIENYDLKYTAKQYLPLGMGFGKPFLQPFLLPDISSLDAIYLFVPHNNIYWILMRLGPIGYLAFWYLIGAVIVRGCLIARQLKDQYLQLVAAYVVGVIAMEIVVAFADYQLYAYRNVIYVGLLFGVLMKLPTLDTKEENPVNEATHGDAELSFPDMGSRYA